ncbi:MAG: hypothetical protein ACI3YH_07625, partial [Eubacteriales bacterium]
GPRGFGPGGPRGFGPRPPMYPGRRRGWGPPPPYGYGCMGCMLPVLSIMALVGGAVFLLVTLL